MPCCLDPSRGAPGGRLAGTMMDGVGITVDLIVRDGNIVVSKWEDWELGHLQCLRRRV